MREQTRGSAPLVRWLACPSTPAAASHPAAILLPPHNSSPCRSRMRAVPRMPAEYSLSAFAATFQALADAVVGADRSTFASSAYPHPVPALWHRSHRAEPTPPLQPTTPPAAVIAPRAYFAIPPIAAVPALHRPDKPPLPVPCRRAPRPWHTLSANGNWSHACLPETHGRIARRNTTPAGRPSRKVRLRRPGP